MHPDDERLARVSRLLRRESGSRQQDVVGPRRTRHFVQMLESGRAGQLRVEDVRDYFGDLGGHARLTVTWNGAQLDRLLDGRHARIVELAIRAVRGYDWPTLSEVTFSEYGERGSVDVLGADEGRSAVFVGEAKSEWGSIEETNRRLDVKARLAPKLVFDRFGWRPRFVAKVLILPEDSTARRIARRYEATLSSTYPARAREIRAWLRRPDGPLAGLWFLSDAG
jgi:hypothetical protein